MKKVINKAIILSIFLLLAVGAKGSKSRTKVGGSHGGNGGLTTMAQTVGVPQGIVQSTSVAGGITTVPVVSLGAQQQQVMTVMQPIVAQPQLTQAGVVKLFDEEEHSREKLHREKEYSALQYVALECIHIIETLDRAQNKLGLGQLALTNNTNPNTVLNKSVVVKYPNISNVGGFGYYLFGIQGSNRVGLQALPMQQPIGMFMTQERSAQIMAVQNFVNKWTDPNTYINTRPDDQGFITNFKASYLMVKNLVKQYLGQDLRSLVLNYPDRINNEISALLAIINNQLLPIMTNNPNYKVPYENLKFKINTLDYNARYIFGLLCENIYSDGQSMSSHNAKIWAQSGIPLTENEKKFIQLLPSASLQGNNFLKAVSPFAAVLSRIKN